MNKEQQATESTVYNYSLISGLVIANIGTKEQPQFIEANLNGLLKRKLRTHNDYVLKDIGKAQQILQAVYLNSVPDDMKPNVKIVDVVIQNLIYLGSMTEAEFSGEQEVAND